MERVIPQDFTMLVPRGSTNETARCRLRCPAVEDIPLVFSATRFAGFNRGMQWEPPTTIDELDEPFRENLLAWEAGILFSFTIADPISDCLLGRIGIHKTNRLDVWNLGFWTHPEHQGRGYMTAAATAMIEFGFERLGATRIEASHALWNKASQRVLEKVGMRFTRYIPHAFQKKGQWIEANKMEITKREWVALNLARS
jgi:[ribosomal protein S5]-alanine N-acetyltransferase